MKSVPTEEVEYKYQTNLGEIGENEGQNVPALRIPSELTVDLSIIFSFSRYLH
jgi:hypothetical protein